MWGLWGIKRGWTAVVQFQNYVSKIDVVTSIILPSKCTVALGDICLFSDNLTNPGEVWFRYGRTT